MLQCVGVVMKVKGCSKVDLINSPSFHFIPHFILTNFPIILSCLMNIPFSLHFDPYPLVSNISLANYPPKVTPYPKPLFPSVKPTPH